MGEWSLSAQDHQKVQTHDRRSYRIEHTTCVEQWLHQLTRVSCLLIAKRRTLTRLFGRLGRMYNTTQQHTTHTQDEESRRLLCFPFPQKHIAWDFFSSIPYCGFSIRGGSRGSSVTLHPSLPFLISSPQAYVQDIMHHEPRQPQKMIAEMMKSCGGQRPHTGPPQGGRSRLEDLKSPGSDPYQEEIKRSTDQLFNIELSSRRTGIFSQPVTRAKYSMWV